MIFERIRSPGIAHLSYFVGEGGQAVVVDPRRDCQVYLDVARREGMVITGIFETHRNEDFVIGSFELQHACGAPVYHGQGLDWKYGTALHDGQEFRIGKLTLTVLHTPGHTDESMTYVLADVASGNARFMAFTGDSLFVNDVGRTDLYGSSEAPRLAATLYDSLGEKIMRLGDGVIICPAHGGGSVCGAKIASREESSIGIERFFNPKLQLRDREAFVRSQLGERLERPPYFRMMEKYNLEGAPLLGRLPDPPPLTVAQFRAEMENGALVVDTNMAVAFASAHIKAALNIWVDGLPGWAGWLLPYDRPVLLVLSDRGQLETAVTYLVRLGYDRIAGYLAGGMEAWYGSGLPFEKVPVMSVQGLKNALDRGEELTVLDVRTDEEWDEGHVPAAEHIYLGRLEQELERLDRSRPIAVHCAIGNRSSVASSILLRAGFRVSNVIGSMRAWRGAGYPVVRTVQEAAARS